MIGPILIALSWLLLRLEGKRLVELGFDRPARRLWEAAVGFAVTALAVVIQQLGLAATAGLSFERNPDLTGGRVLELLRLNLNSVLFEELVFRGYLLWQLLRWLGERKGVWLGAVAFGAYHWFSWGVFGQPVPMVVVMILTGSFGYMLCLAFARTGSVAAPIGLHLGWNLTSYLGFSQGPFGPGLWVPAAEVSAGWQPVFFNLGLPLVAVIGVSVWLHRRPSTTRTARP